MGDSYGASQEAGADDVSEGVEQLRVSDTLL